MGDFEVLLVTLSEAMLALIVYNLINSLTFKNTLRRFGLLRVTRRDFYECGFKPQAQKPIRMSMQFLIISIFFLLYDVELIFLFPYVSGLSYNGLYETLLIFFFFFVFIISLYIDYDRHALT